MKNNLIEKKSAFITGSSSGIGFGLAKKFLDRGYEVIICSNNIKKLKKSSKALNDCFYIKADLTSEKDIKSAIRKIKAKFKKVDVLVCNYGNSDFKKNNLDFKHSFNNNFFPTVNTVMNGVSILKKTGRIICISSICGIELIKNAPIGYSVAKSALNSFVKSISFVLSKKGILINSIAPGNIYFKDSVWEKKFQKNKKKIKKFLNENVPMEKFGTIDNIFELCYFLSSDKSFSTGATYILDGGQTRKF
tara:strand:+ start:793 stop:1536 length:744 start_codon:yes stop_codon:yes gene_type:complete